MQFLEEVDKLIQLLEESTILKDYKNAKNRVLEDKELLKKIEQYHQGNLAMEKEILEKKCYQEYQKKSSELSLLMFGINLKFQNLKGDFACGLSKENIKDVS